MYKWEGLLAVIAGCLALMAGILAYVAIVGA